MTRGTWAIATGIAAVFCTVLGLHAGLVQADGPAALVALGFGVTLTLVTAGLVSK